jgi:prepilin-type N-terminal cleavage/methylation domain-containing protein
MHSPARGFTLVELIITIAIVAFLSIVVILAINPAQLLQQARDSNRLSDMSTLNTALGVYVAQGGTSLGSANTIYVSIPDPAASSTSAGDNCIGLGLLSLPAGYAYHCAASSTYRATDGTGWMTVNFTNISGGSPIGQLPVDPVNTSSSRLYYTYETNSSQQYETTAVFESQKYKLGGSNDQIVSDGGTLASVYEKGTKIGLEPLDYGDPSLVGYWTMDEGTSSIAYDYSGQNATGSWNGTATGTSGYYSAGKIGPYAGAFDGVSTYVGNVGNSSGLVLTTGMTLVAWVKLTSLGSDVKIISKRPSYILTVYSTNVPETEIFIGGTSQDTRGVAGGTVLTTGKWYQIAGTYNGSVLTTYVNGALDRQLAVTGSMDNVSYVLNLGKTADGAANYFPGLIDDARVYNRALSAAELAALYAGNK